MVLSLSASTRRRKKPWRSRRSDLRRRTMECHRPQSARFPSLKESNIPTLSNWKRSSILKTSCTWSSSILNLTWRSICAHKAPSHYQENRRSAFYTKSCSRSSICTSTGFSIEIWNHKICWSILRAKTSSSLILVLPALLASQLKLTRTRWSRCGTAAPKFCLGRRLTLWASTYGLPGAFSLRWFRDDRSLWATLKSTRFSKSSRFWEPQTKTTGPTP